MPHRIMSVIYYRLVTVLNNPRLFARAAQFVLFAVAGFVAFLLRFEFVIPAEHVRQLMIGVLVWLVVKPIVFHLNGLDRGWWRWVSIPDIARIGTANLIASAVSLVFIVLLTQGFPRSIFVIDLLLSFLASSGLRVVARIAAESVKASELKPRKTALIYGAGSAGVMLLRESRANTNFGYKIIGFIDDDLTKRGSLILNVPVLGPRSGLPAIVQKYAASEILIALPSATGPEMRTILECCQRAGLTCKTIPTLAEVLEGRTQATQVRDVAVEDLLGRSPIRLEEGEIRSKIESRVVLVTGAAGSIGSELCRQIARFGPAKLVGFDLAETGLFFLAREMRQHYPDVEFHPAIGDIRNRQRVGEILGEHAPAILFHAAAYKHVPLMETHVFEAIETNVMGTRNLAVAAAEFGVSDFVMISSDKAVRPTSVMGVTKRISELMIQSLQARHTKYVSVRFGNVLGSNGSVIPVFKMQIAERRPLTVTHPEMRRFFMTIPEAAQLVLQASTMGKGGEIFVLDMGEPIRITDLARNLILLSGLRPDEDIRIIFTGLRPGEKLYEEISHADEEVLPTYHEKIKIFRSRAHDDDRIAEHIDELREICSQRDLASIVLQLKDLVIDYNPSIHLLQRVLQEQRSRTASLVG